MNTGFETVEQLKSELKSYSGAWNLIGGWAVDCHVGHVTRYHHDIEISVFRNQQLELISYFTSLEATIAWQEEHQWYPWSADTFLDWPLHQIRIKTSTGFEFDVLLNDDDETDWVFRRDRRVRRNKEHICIEKGAPFPPELLLIYKARDPSAKDDADFALLKPLLQREQLVWLKSAISLAYPNCKWLVELN